MIIESILGGLLSEALSESKIPAAVVRKVVPAVVNAAVADPVVKNQMNMEPPAQSRVVWGSTTGVFASLAVVLTQLTSNQFPNYDWGLLIPAVMALAGSGYSLYGRLWGGLAPLFGKK